MTVWDVLTWSKYNNASSTFNSRTALACPIGWGLILFIQLDFLFKTYDYRVTCLPCWWPSSLLLWVWSLGSITVLTMWLSNDNVNYWKIIKLNITEKSRQWNKIRIKLLAAIIKRMRSVLLVFGVWHCILVVQIILKYK